MDCLLIALAIFVPQVASLHANDHNSSTYTSDDPKDLRRTFQVRIAALTCSTVSLVASLVVLYWFCRMKKRFRHRLIILLLWGDLMRTIWLFLFVIISFARGTIKTNSAFCQSSGFLVQYGTETSDYAVLVIAVHSALQIFRPSTQSTPDGLYPYQRYVYAAALLIPTLMSSLAFINSQSGYSSLGAFCTLPIRPFWYRLALNWIPRYIIATIIISLAVAIYAYVGFEFRAYSEITQSVRTPHTSTSPRASRHERHVKAAVDTPEIAELKFHQQRRASSIAHDIVSSHRGVLSVSFASVTPDPSPVLLDPDTSTQSLPANSRHSPLNPGQNIRPSLSIIPSSSNVRPLHPLTSASTGPRKHRAYPSETESHVSYPTSSPAQLNMARQRARIHRQLRLMFIYPLAYTLMWLLPFILHCMMYKDKYALRPIWILRLGATICVTSMGFIDCLIFSLREKPWRSIPTSDGTFWGSFAIWRTCEVAASESQLERGHGESKHSVEREKGSGTFVRSRRIKGITTNEGVDDYMRMAASQARLRLHLEREARVAALNARIARRSGSVCQVNGHDDSSGSHYSEGGSAVLSTDLRETDVKRKGKEIGEPSLA